MTKLTIEDLQHSVSLLSQVSLPVKDSPIVIAIINKMNKMADELRTEPKEK